MNGLVTRRALSIAGWWVVVSALVSGCASTEAPVARRPPTVDVSGTWNGTWPSSFGGFPVTMILKQTQADVAGDIVVTGSSQHAVVASGALRGAVDGDRFSFSSPRGADAEVTVQGNEMKGYTRTGGALLLRRQ
jgi:hypothetical protein